ncbi:hypothetical protein ACEWY4_011540 [Coilia grayii]|uniref:Sperm-tail PG-rich repeat-containing protein 2 n=1 Tax=Coilia grayii TaxID=363190 RepID=A0ABD1JXX0_9TELE
MYGRSPRLTCFTGGSTSSNLGPGSYEVSHYQTVSSDGYAPFLSLTKRQSLFHRSSDALTTPGPGQYNALLKSHVVGGQSLKSRSERFKEKDSFVPGPGAYDLSVTTTKPKVTSRKESTKAVVPYRVKFVQQPGIPSIPSPGQSYGYEENSQGMLCKQSAPEKDDTLGPAFYNPVQVEKSSSQKYKGIHFGNRTGKRKDQKVIEGPGPGHYDPDAHNAPCYENLNLRKERSRAELVIPRYHEIVTLQEEKKGVPGPGQYYIKSQFEKTSSPYGAPLVHSPPFLSQAERFTPVKEVAPPVGTYNDPRCALELLQKTSGLKKSGFGLTAMRFVSEKRKPSTPGPGAYNIFDYGLAQESVKKAILESTRKGAFGSSARRSPIFVNKADMYVPGPAEYQVEKKSEELYKRQQMAVFKSETKRLSTPPMIMMCSLHSVDFRAAGQQMPFGSITAAHVRGTFTLTRQPQSAGDSSCHIPIRVSLQEAEPALTSNSFSQTGLESERPIDVPRQAGGAGDCDTPPPSLYNVREAYESAYGHAHYTPPRNEDAKRRQGSFLSAAPRRLTLVHSSPNVPGPGHYNPEVKSSARLTLIGSHEDRFKSHKDTTPGPGAYQTETAVRTEKGPVLGGVGQLRVIGLALAGLLGLGRRESGGEWKGKRTHPVARLSAYASPGMAVLYVHLCPAVVSLARFLICCGVTGEVPHLLCVTGEVPHLCSARSHWRGSSSVTGEVPHLSLVRFLICVLLWCHCVLCVTGDVPHLFLVHRRHR